MPKKKSEDPIPATLEGGAIHTEVLPRVTPDEDPQLPLFTEQGGNIIYMS